MAAPGSLRARYQELAGAQDQRTELYIARRRLGFTIDEWLALPWWQRRVYVEGMTDEAEAREHTQSGKTAPTGLDAIMHGSMSDVRASTAFGTGR